MRFSIVAGIVFVICSMGMAADAPSSLTNQVYYEFSRTTTRSSVWQGFALEDGGIARGLFVSRSGPGLEGQFLTAERRDGTWTYTKGLNGTAELLIRLPGRVGFERRTLAFSNADSGTARFDDNGEAFSVFALQFYLAPLTTRPPLVNCSNRSFISPGRSAFTGFVVTGDRPRAVLVRAVGPSLRLFGISDPLSDPQLSITHGGRVISQNDDWQSEGETSVVATNSFVGAFPLTTASKDAALVVMLAPGDYVAEVTGATMADSGQTLIEVYMLP
jgi:hypothetical protein